jgi:hypothetical protein
MRRALVLCLLSLAACQPREYHQSIASVVPVDRDVMRCALGEARRLGYEIYENDPQEGTSRAQRMLGPPTDAPSRFDVLTFDMLDEVAPSRTFRVSAVTLVNGGDGRGPHYLDPTAEAMADRDRVVSVCVTVTP